MNPRKRYPARARNDAAQLRFEVCTLDGCRKAYFVDGSVVGRHDLCPDCRLVDMAVNCRIPLR